MRALNVTLKFKLYSVSWQSHRFMSKGMRFLLQKTGENTKSLERVNLRQDDHLIFQ